MNALSSSEISPVWLPCGITLAKRLQKNVQESQSSRVPFLLQEFTKANSKSVNKADTEELPHSYSEDDLNAFSISCDYIRRELFQSNSTIELVRLSDMLREMLESGVTEIKASTTSHLKRKLSVEFGDSLHLIKNESIANKVIGFPDSLTSRGIS